MPIRVPAILANCLVVTVHYLKVSCQGFLYKNGCWPTGLCIKYILCHKKTLHNVLYTLPKNSFCQIKCHPINGPVKIGSFVQKTRGCIFITLDHLIQNMNILPISAARLLVLWFHNDLKVHWFSNILYALHIKWQLCMLYLTCGKVLHHIW